jgi:membrane protein implicated in regulation of membrane protease activity
VFIGSAALVVGLITGLTSSITTWAQWAIFAVLTQLLDGVFSEPHLRPPARPPAERFTPGRPAAC